jgi:signal transduction histidine kinase
MPRWHFSWRIAHELGGWRGTASVLGVVAVALSTVMLLRPDARSVPSAAAVTGLIVFPIVLAAAIFIYVHWRLSETDVAAWSTVALVMMAAPNLMLSGLLLADPGLAEDAPLWPLSVQLVIAAAMLIVASTAEHLRYRVDPLGLGLLLGGGLVVATIVLWGAAPPLSTPIVVLALFSVLPVLVALALAWYLLERSTLPVWGRLRLALGVVLLTIGQVCDAAAGTGPWTAALGIVALVTGAGLVCSTTWALARMAIRDNNEAIARLHERVQQADARVRQERERLHEIGATVAGIASASRLIHQDPVVTPLARRSVLTEMMDAEVARLERLILGEPQGPRAFALDEVIRQLVTLQNAQGRPVTWSPSGHQVVGRPDDVAEVVNILLDNAAKHGGGADTSVEVRRVGEAVEIAVSDSGPGISPDVRDDIFAWEARGPGSSGQGIGLHIARTLVEEQGGYLMLEDSPSSGTTFVVGLAGGERDGALGHTAI